MTTTKGLAPLLLADRREAEQPKRPTKEKHFVSLKKLIVANPAPQAECVDPTDMTTGTAHEYWVLKTCTLITQVVDIDTDIDLVSFNMHTISTEA